MPASNYPNGFANGITVREVPLLQAQPGRVFWVGNNATNLLPGQRGASNANYGTFLSPLSTVAAALLLCVQGRGDIIMVRPNHLETLSDATTLTLSMAGVAIVGLGTGISRPTFILSTATTANIPVLAAGISIQNCLFLCNFAAVASVFTALSASCATSTISGTTFNAVAATGTIYPGASLFGTGVIPGTEIVSQLTGTTGGIGTYLLNQSQTVASTTITCGTPDFAIDNCEFRDLSSALNVLTIFTASATANMSDGFSFTNNRISSLGTTAATTALKTTVNQDRWQIRDNYGNWAVLNDTAAMLAAGAASITNFEFSRNFINRPNTSTTSGLAISTSGTAWTGQCNDNRIWGLNNIAQTWINTGTKLAFNQNFCPITAAADKSGLINPAAV
jgi:hypothetical protein